VGCPIDQSVLAPYANFSATPRIACVGQTVSFTDLSTFSPTAWSWSFPGGNPNSSTAQNPSVVYNSPGTYPVTLVATMQLEVNYNTNFFHHNKRRANTSVCRRICSEYFLPNGWTGVNVGNQNAYWKRSATTGHNSNESVYFNNLSYNVPTEHDEMRSMGLNFTGYTSLTFTFDVCLRKNILQAEATHWKFLASTDCGATWTTIYLKADQIFLR